MYDFVCKSLETNTYVLIFIDAPGGTGQTFLINLIFSNIKENGDVAIASASSGIVATLMSDGRTAHSRFKISIAAKGNGVRLIKTHIANIFH